MFQFSSENNNMAIIMCYYTIVYIGAVISIFSCLCKCMTETEDYHVWPGKDKKGI